MVAEEMAWDLSQLVEKVDLMFIQKQLQLMVEEAGRVRENYHGKIGKLDANGLLRFLELRDAYTLKFDGVRLSPRELAAELGLGITEKTFWEKDMRQAELFVTALEETLTK